MTLTRIKDPVSVFAGYLGSGRMFPAMSRGSWAVLLRRGVALVLLLDFIGALLLVPGNTYFVYGYLPLIIGSVLSVCLMVGLMLPIVIPSMIVALLSVFASIGGFRSLGIDASLWALVALALAPGMSYRDLDQVLIRSGSRLGASLARVYNGWHKRSEYRTLLGRWISLLFFGLTAAYSVGLHLKDPFWESGLVGPYLLTSTYMSRFHDVWISALTEYSFLLTTLSFLSAAFIPIFGLLCVLIFFRGRLAASVVRLATISFFVFSLFFLQLGILPVIEILLWIFWFVPRQGQPTIPVIRNPSIVVLYDDMCGLCQGTRRVLGKIDTTNAVVWAPVSESGDALKVLALSKSDATRDITAVTSSGRVVFGYDFYLRITPWIPLLAPSVPLLIVGKWLKVGPAIYSLVRARRNRKAEYCQLTPERDRTGLADVVPVLNQFVEHGRAGMSEERPPEWEGIFLTTLALSALFYASTNPLVGQSIDTSVLTPSIVKTLSSTYGLNPIDVFNEADLKMSEHWITVSVLSEGQWKLLPITYTNGARGAVQQIDSLYFGHTLQFRRSMIDKSDTERCEVLEEYITNPRMAATLELLGVSSQDSVRLDLYEQSLPEVASGGTLVWVQAQPNLVCTSQVK